MNMLYYSVFYIFLYVHMPKRRWRFGWLDIFVRTYYIHICPVYVHFILIYEYIDIWMSENECGTSFEIVSQSVYQMKWFDKFFGTTMNFEWAWIEIQILLSASSEWTADLLTKINFQIFQLNVLKTDDMLRDNALVSSTIVVRHFQVYWTYKIGSFIHYHFEFVFTQRINDHLNIQHEKKNSKPVVHIHSHSIIYAYILYTHKYK